jgi:predicted AAA+ superfamily ATPase
MEKLIQKSEKKAALSKDKIRRYLYSQIDWIQRLILILGYRGTGKTTLVLQYLSSLKSKGIYLSLDDFYFETNRLIEVIEALYQLGYRTFVLDEVHRYEYWSRDLKQLYDDFEDIQIIATGSSIMDISKGSSDLSRRAVVYKLNGLSFREYLNFHFDLDLKTFSLKEIIEQHIFLTEELLDTIAIKKEFEKYLKYGYYPFHLEGIRTYHQKLEETINLIIDIDIAPFSDLQYSTTRIMKKLLFILSESVPFTPNVQKLAEKLECPRNTVLRLMDLLNQAQILQLLKTSTEGISYLQKPEKIYLQNSNLVYTFSSEPNVGNLRETFFFNQLSVVHKVSAPKYGDFLIDEQFLFEVGGSSKTNELIKGLPNAYLALDIASGNDKRIPLWLFGFLY